MNLSGRRCLSLLLIAFAWLSLPASAQDVPTGSGFLAPCGVAVDPSGNLFAGDEDDHAVFEVLAAGGYVDVYAYGLGEFASACGVAVDRAGDLFVTDLSNNGTVREVIAADGSIPASPVAVTISGALSSPFGIDPFGIAVDPIGNVFVTNGLGGSVDEILAAGGYTTVNRLGPRVRAVQGFERRGAWLDERGDRDVVT